jgi:hypothetical protein
VGWWVCRKKKMLASHLEEDRERTKSKEMGISRVERNKIEGVERGSGKTDRGLVCRDTGNKEESGK